MQEIKSTPEKSKSNNIKAKDERIQQLEKENLKLLEEIKA